MVNDQRIIRNKRITMAATGIPVCGVLGADPCSSPEGNGLSQSASPPRVFSRAAFTCHDSDRLDYRTQARQSVSRSPTFGCLNSKMGSNDGITVNFLLTITPTSTPRETQAPLEARPSKRRTNNLGWLDRVRSGCRSKTTTASPLVPIGNRDLPGRPSRDMSRQKRFSHLTMCEHEGSREGF